jgi:hypothetical protein
MARALSRMVCKGAVHVLDSTEPTNGGQIEKEVHIIETLKKEEEAISHSNIQRQHTFTKPSPSTHSFRSTFEAERTEDGPFGSFVTHLFIDADQIVKTFDFIIWFYAKHPQRWTRCRFDGRLSGDVPGVWVGHGQSM